MTKIEWTDTTWNPIVGCSVVSAGCANCYAMKFAGRMLDGNPKIPQYKGTTQKSKAGPVWTGKVALAPENILHAPLRWKSPKLIFVNSMGDLFHEDVPDDWIDQVFAVMALCQQHTFQCLTKRPLRMANYCGNPQTFARIYNLVCDLAVDLALNVVLIHPDLTLEPPPGPQVKLNVWPLPNVWLGTSVEDQASADARIPHLLATPAAIRFISAEPLLGPVDLSRWLLINWQCAYCRGYFSGRHLEVCPDCGKRGGWCGSHKFNGRGIPPRRGFPHQVGHGLDWVIVGGESGPGARPMQARWALDIRAQCRDANVAFFFKQWGEFLPEDMADAQGFHWQAGHSDPRVYRWPDGARSIRIGKARAGRLLDGREHNDFPEPVIPAQDQTSTGIQEPAP